MRLNITLPDNLAEELKKKPNKSGYIAEALREKLRKEKRATLLMELREGYGASGQEDMEVNSEWEEVSEGEWE